MGALFEMSGARKGAAGVCVLCVAPKRVRNGARAGAVRAERQLQREHARAAVHGVTLGWVKVPEIPVPESRAVCTMEQVEVVQARDTKI